MFDFSGVCTIQTLVSRKFSLESGFPRGHFLQSCPAYESIPNKVDVMVEDWNCPGLEELILPWIEGVSELENSVDLLTPVCTKLITILDNNWRQNFER